jgi:signal transduction histidine kinase
LQASEIKFKGNTLIEIVKAQKIILEASTTIRNLSHTLVSSILLKFGLSYALKDMTDKYSNSQVFIETDIENVIRYHQCYTTNNFKRIFGYFSRRQEF